MNNLIETYKGKRVLVTGATGLKGSWLTLWLRKMAAKVYCASLPPHTTPNHYDILGYGNSFPFVDLRSYQAVKEIFHDFKPEIVLHLAAQAIVRESFRDPWGTFGSNIMGAVNVLEACLQTPSVKAIVVITSDKTYLDRNWCWPYRETDELGGTDPYSSSKVCVEYVAASYRESFGMNIATARAGNCVAGADWGAYRLIPDIMRATAEGKPVEIHTPHATRPYQHVLEALHGYLRLGKALLEGREECKTAFNFGPDGSMSVLEVLEIAQSVWPKIQYIVKEEETHPGMVNLLKIDSTKAKQLLGWKPRWTMEQAVIKAVMWYRDYYETGEVFSIKDIKDFMKGEGS
ncbi:MAG: CDP-glucose 4,6-dehydratase [Methanoregula sp.]|jgi:CDP-glucose 4,6-dehydratase